MSFSRQREAYTRVHHMSSVVVYFNISTFEICSIPVCANMRRLRIRSQGFSSLWIYLGRRVESLADDLGGLRRSYLQYARCLSAKSHRRPWLVDDRASSEFFGACEIRIFNATALGDALKDLDVVDPRLEICARSSRCQSVTFHSS